MKKIEKQLIKKLENHYHSSDNTKTDFTKDENKILVKWNSLGYLNSEAFHDITPWMQEYKSMMQISAFYPWSLKGYEILRKNWYIKLREMPLVIILRDLFLLFAFIASLWFTLKNISYSFA